MTPAEQLIQRYCDAFNGHDIEGVMGCFHENPVMVDATGTRFEGREEVRRHYETGFALMPDCRCDLRMLAANSGRAVADSFFLRKPLALADSSNSCSVTDSLDRGEQAVKRGR
jgi:hypothetical protein